MPTTFGRVLGISSIPVGAKATACAPCSYRKLDIALVLDRTHSMCQDDYGNDQSPTCPDLANARSGIETFLKLLDPQLDRVALVVTPPPPNASSRCVAPQDYNAYPTTSDGLYVMVPLSNDYRQPGSSTLNPSSSLVDTLDNCIKAGGNTAYKQALRRRTTSSWPTRPPARRR